MGGKHPPIFCCCFVKYTFPTMGVDWFHCFFFSFSESDSFLASSKFLNSEKWYHGSNRPWCLGYRYFWLKAVPGFKKKK